jgi:hypothetical protein
VELAGCPGAARRVDTVNQGMTLIAMTGWGQASDKRQALAAVFDHQVLALMGAVYELPDLGDHDGSLPDRGGDALDRACANVAYCEYAGQ